MRGEYGLSPEVLKSLGGARPVFEVPSASLEKVMCVNQVKSRITWYLLACFISTTELVMAAAVRIVMRA